MKKEQEMNAACECSIEADKNIKKMVKEGKGPSPKKHEDKKREVEAAFKKSSK